MSPKLTRGTRQERNDGHQHGASADMEPPATSILMAICRPNPKLRKFSIYPRLARMLASLITLLTNPGSWRYLLASPFSIIISVFQIWMFVHAIRQREWIWAI